MLVYGLFVLFTLIPASDNDFDDVDELSGFLSGVNVISRYTSFLECITHSKTNTDAGTVKYHVQVLHVCMKSSEPVISLRH